MTMSEATEDHQATQRGPRPPTSYVIRGGAAGKARLHVLAEALAPTTRALLDAAGLGESMACLDIGCGGGDVALELARRVGPHGRVVGMDMDEVKLALARQDAEAAGLSNIEFQACDATTLDVEGVYDLVYARFLLTHLRDPEQMARRMVRAAKPGGVVVIEDLDHSAAFCHPRCPALERHVAFYNYVARQRGADPVIGPRLPALLREAGAGDPQLRVIQPVFMQGAAKRIHQITLENIAEAITATGLATAAELSAMAAELEAFTQDPHTIIGFPRIFQVWGRRGPDAAACA
jgi:ubiquinone/menaquinone biosynthesis C-methylase UbiE